MTKKYFSGFLLFVFALANSAASASDIDSTVEKIRELKFKEPVSRVIMTSEGMGKYLKKKIDEELPAERLRIMQLVLVKFGLLPKNTDLLNSFYNLYTEQAAGLYDPKVKKFFILDKLPDKISQLYMDITVDAMHLLSSHELTHALQDQYYDLQKLLPEEMDIDDRSTAVMALAEGDATLVMLEYLAQCQGQTVDTEIEEALETIGNTPVMELPAMSDADIFNNSPLFLRENLLFPYISGLRFVVMLKKKGGWDKINQAYTFPPASTEQVLHPEKFFSKEMPVLITLPSFREILKKCELLETGSIGELNISILAREFLPEKDAISVGPGWGGDSFAVYRQDSGLLLVWFTTWDTTAAADTFFEAMKTVLEKKYPDAKPVNKQKSLLEWKNETTCNYLEKKNRDILIVETCSEDILPNLVKTAWKSRKSIAD